MDIKALRALVTSKGYTYFIGSLHNKDGSLTLGFSTDARGKDDSLTLIIKADSNDMISHRYNKNQQLITKEWKDISDDEVFRLIKDM